MPYATLVMEDGSEMRVEIEDSKRYRGQLSDKDAFSGIKEHFSNVMNLIKTTAQNVHSSYMSLPNEIRPKEFEISFGITISAESGVVFSKVGSEGNFEVTLRWGMDET